MFASRLPNVTHGCIYPHRTSTRCSPAGSATSAHVYPNSCRATSGAGARLRLDERLVRASVRRSGGGALVVLIQKILKRSLTRETPLLALPAAQAFEDAAMCCRVWNSQSPTGARVA